MMVKKIKSSYYCHGRSLGAWQKVIYFSLRSTLQYSMLFYHVTFMLQNAETWLRLTKTDLKQLETSDEILLRKLLDAPSKSPIPSLYLEFGVQPIRFILKSKRVMYLHYLLRRDPEEMIAKVFQAQMDKPAKGDWCLVVMEDLNTLGLGHLTLDDIKSKTKSQMKLIVKKASKKAALDYLLQKKENLSKMSNLNYSTLELQAYLSSDQVNLRLKRFAFKIRTRMIQVGHNFGRKITCQVCQIPGTEDSQKHALFECCTIQNLINPTGMGADQVDPVKYEDIFTGEVGKINRVVKQCDSVFRKRLEIMENKSM